MRGQAGRAKLRGGVVRRAGRGVGRALSWVTVRPVNFLLVRPVRWVGSRGSSFVARHADLLVWLAAGIMLVIGWPTVGMTYEVTSALWPLVAALGVLPLIWLRVAPFFGWVSWVIPGALFPLVFRYPPNAFGVVDGRFPWQITAFLVLLALLITVGVKESPARIGLTLLGTALIFLAYLPDGMSIGWIFGAAAFTGLGVLLRGLSRSRSEAAEQKRRAEEQTRRAEEQASRAELEAARAVVAEERTRIARDLHDVVAHRMSMVVVQAQSAQYRLDGVSPEVAAEFESVAVQAREALNEVRVMLGVLRSEEHGPDQAPQPGAEDVLRLLRATSQAGVDLSWSVTGEHQASPTTEMVLYRVLQESLANATRHAPGAPVRVEIGYDEQVAVQVASGPGHRPPGEVSGSGGHGIPGMSARAASVGGRLTASPTSDGGWLVSATLPARPTVVG